MSSGGGGTQTTVQKNDPWGPSQPYLMRAMGDAENLYESGGLSATPYSGDRVANMTAPTVQGLSGIVDTAQDTSLIDNAGGFLSNAMNSNYQTDQLEAVKNNALSYAVPKAASMFAGSGMMNSTQAMDTVGRAATEAIAPYEYGAFESAQNRGMSAAGMAPSVDAARYTPMQQMLGAGAMLQDQNQREIDADMAAHYEAGNREANDLAMYTNMLLGYGGQGGTSEGTTTTSSNPSAGGILGGALGGLGLTKILFPALFASDSRLKRTIRRIGQTLGGTSLYSFKYLLGETVHVGVMAHEVPNAVLGQIDGYDVVDYARVV